MIFSCFLMLLLSVQPHRAEDAHLGVGKDGVRFAVAMPGFESTVSLGVYNSEDRLVRRLAEVSPEGDFPSGLNGRIFFWDGKDDQGESVSAGTYAFRGYAVGAPSLVEESFRAADPNAWIEGRIQGDTLRNIQALPGGDLLALGETPEGLAIVRITQNGELLWTTALHDWTGFSGTVPFHLSGGEGSLGVLSGQYRGESSLLFFALDSGLGVSLIPFPEVDALALFGTTLVAASGKTLVEVCLRTGEVTELQSPAKIASLDLGPSGLALLSPQGFIHVWSETGWFEFPQGGVFHSLSWGVGETLWAVLSPDSVTFEVGQFDALSGEYLRRILSPEGRDAMPPTVVSASSIVEVVYSAAISSRGFFLRGIRQEMPEGLWLTFLEVGAAMPLEQPVQIHRERWIDLAFRDALSGFPGRVLLQANLSGDGKILVRDATGLNLLQLGSGRGGKSVGLRPGRGIYDFILDLAGRGWEMRYGILGVSHHLALLDGGDVEWIPAE